MIVTNSVAAEKRAHQLMCISS